MELALIRGLKCVVFQKQLWWDMLWKTYRNLRNVGEPTVLNEAEERILLDWIVKMGFPVTKWQLICVESVSNLKQKNPFKNNILKKNGLTDFLHAIQRFKTGFNIMPGSSYADCHK